MVLGLRRRVARENMRLISWNVNGRYGTALPRQIEEVHARRPDIVALQEVRAESHAAWQLGMERAGLKHQLDSADLLHTAAPTGSDYKRRYYNVLASRYELEPLDGLPLAFPERYLGAVVRAENGQELELHNAHAPPGSTRGRIKIELFSALAARLGRPSSRPRILCGDFNTPASEAEDGKVEFWGRAHPGLKDEWDEAERSVILGLAEHDLADVFRRLNGYAARDVSWILRRKGKEFGRRYDHVFASEELEATSCCYLHVLRKARLSDHAPIEADFAGWPTPTGGQ